MRLSKKLKMQVEFGSPVFAERARQGMLLDGNPRERRRSEPTCFRW